MAKIIKLTENDIQRMVKKIIKQSLNENMNLGGYFYINADDDELDFIRDNNFKEDGKIEVHGHEVYYDDQDADVMAKMRGLFPNEFDENNNQIGFGNPIEYDEDELGWAEDLANDKSSRANNFRDLYNDPRLQEDAWGIAQMFPTHALDGLLGEDVNGKSVPFGNIQDLLNQSADTPGFEKYTSDEWESFFETVRTEGI
jgi:hypothetical protein